METSEDLSLLIQKLNLDDSSERLKQLLDIKAILVSTSMQTVVTADNLENLFSSLSSNNSEEVEVCCYIVEKILAKLDGRVILDKLAHYLSTALQHHNPQVVQLALNQLVRMLVTTSPDHVIGALAQARDLLSHVMSLLSEEDEEEMGATSLRFLSRLGARSRDAASMLLGQHHLLKQLLDQMSKNDTIRFRIYELVSNIAAASPEHLDICIKSKILDRFIQELKDDDVLLKVTCCTMLADLVSTNHVLAFLIERGVVGEMTKTLTQADNDPFAYLYIPAVVRFFGKVCSHRGVVYLRQMFADFVPLLFNLVLNGDQGGDRSIQLTAVDTLALIAHTPDGKVLLAQSGDRFFEVLKVLNRLTTNSDVKCQLAAISALSAIMQNKKTSRQSECEDLTSQWFESTTNMSHVVSLCKQPHPQVKVAAFNLLEAISCNQWGVKSMSEHPSFVEFLLDRTADTNVDVKQARFDLIRWISNLSSTPTTFGNREYLEFRKYVQQGVHYVPTQLHVATEEA